MWDSAEAVERALATGDLEETHVFDGKRIPGQNRDIAIDVCAMTIDGGTLLYGVSEDDNGRITVSTPTELRGARERIDQIVQTSIMEPPTIYVSELPTEDDPAVGYLVVRVPQSPRAPHQVIVGNDMRFYGRGATGNRRLTESEVGRLYERRDRWAVDRDAHLDAVVEASLFDDAVGWGYLHAFARPFGFDPSFLRSRIIENEQEMRNSLVAAASRNGMPDYVTYEPDLRQQRGWQLHGTEGVRIGSAENDRRRVIRVSIAREGEARIFCCCGARVRDYGPVSIYENVLGGNLASFLSVAGDFYRQAGYIGAADVGVAVTGLRGSHSHFVIVEQRDVGALVSFEDGIDQDAHRRTERFLASDLQERPKEVAEALLRDLFDALVGIGFTPYR